MTDRLRLCRSLLIASVLVVFSCMTRGFAQCQLTLLLAVAFFGLGEPLVSVGATKLIKMWFNEHERKLATEIYITGMALGRITVLSQSPIP